MGLRGGLWHQIFAGISACMGAFTTATLFAWVTPILPHLLSENSTILMTPQQASWMISAPGFTNLITPIPSGIMSDMFGRKMIILSVGPLFTIGWLMILFWKTYTSLVIARCIQGACVGIIFTTVPVYLGEIASVQYRGAISSLFFIFYWSGYFFEYTSGPFLSFYNLTVLTLSTVVIFFIMMCFQPESPYFYLITGQTEEARKSLKWFRGSEENSVDSELDNMIRTVKEEQNKKGAWREVIGTKTDRKALYVIFFVGAARTLTGLIPIVSYATHNFNITSNFVIKPEYLTMVLGIVLLLGASCSFFFLDYFGRRPLFITSALGSSIALFMTATYYFFLQRTSVDVSAYNFVPPIAILFDAGISVGGMFPVYIAYASELFTSKTRSTASSLASLFATLLHVLTLKLYQNLVDIFGIHFNFYLYSAIGFVAAIIGYLFIPETKNKSFEQIRLEINKFQ